MREFFRNWVMSIFFLSLFSSLIGKMLPGRNYEGYIRMFCGMIMLLVLLSPILKITGLEEELETLWTEKVLEVEEKQMEEHLKRMEKWTIEKIEEAYYDSMEESSGEEEDGEE